MDPPKKRIPVGIKKAANAALTLIWLCLFTHYTDVMHAVAGGSEFASLPIGYYCVETWGLASLAALTWVINKFLEE